MFKLLNVWDNYMPGQFIEPHKYFLHHPDWTSYVCGSQVLETPRAEKHIYAMSSYRDQASVIKKSLFQTIKSKLQGRYLWRKFNHFTFNVTQEVQPDLVLFHFATTAAQMLPYIEKLNCRTCVILYGVDASAALKQDKWLVKYKQLFNKIDLFLVLSEKVSKRLFDHGCPKHKIRVWNLPAGIEEYPYRPPAHKNATGNATGNATSNPTRFLAAARFIEKKGLPILIKAFSLLYQSNPNISLTLVGYGKQKHQLLQLINQLNLSSCITVVDTQAKADFASVYYPLLKNHDIFVLPSTEGPDGDDEGGPALTLICAQSAGLPVICTPFVGSEISVFDNESGLFCQMNDPQSLCEKMQFLSIHRELWEPFGRRGSEIVHNLFSQDRQCQLLECHFSYLISQDPLV